MILTWKLEKVFNLISVEANAVLVIGKKIFIKISTDDYMYYLFQHS